MTTYYVGPGGNNANSGLTWALRKLTLNGVEDIPVAAGDTVYVAPGTYRELLTIDVSGSNGSPIAYIGDYYGVNTDGIGGVVRITGSDNDQTIVRANCVTATSKDYRTFTGFVMDGSSGVLINLATACTGWIINQCFVGPPSGNAVAIFVGGTGTNNAIRNCVVVGNSQASNINFTHTATVSDSGHSVENCVFWGGNAAVRIDRVGGITIRNCTFMPRAVTCVHVVTALELLQTITVNNCILFGASTGFNATLIGEITENYNNLYAVTTARTNTSTGANSNTFVALLDTRWFFDLVNGKGRMLSPYDLASYSQLVNLAGTSPTTTDMRGTAIQGAQREWGALEHDTRLKVRSMLPIHVMAGGING